jgi:hypothetical protein
MPLNLIDDIQRPDSKRLVFACGDKNILGAKNTSH